MKSKYNRKRKDTRSQPSTPTLGSRAMEYMRDKLRVYVDKYATVDGDAVKYSLYNPRTKTATKKTMHESECIRIFQEMTA